MMRAIMFQLPAMRLAPRLLIATLGVVLLLGGCVYRQTIQQGNYLDPEAVKQLQTGMTRSQVRFLLGTPMLPDSFDRDRWDYVYFLQIGRERTAEQWRLTVYFEDDKVSKIDNAGVPETRDLTAGAEGANRKNKALKPGSAECKRRWYWPVGCRS
jgi:outer membrane protein assembly factor BamE